LSHPRYRDWRWWRARLLATALMTLGPFVIGWIGNGWLGYPWYWVAVVQCGWLGYWAWRTWPTRPQNRRSGTPLRDHAGNGVATLVDRL
jgi:hypothetical protein